MLSEVIQDKMNKKTYKLYFTLSGQQQQENIQIKNNQKPIMQCNNYNTNSHQ